MYNPPKIYLNELHSKFDFICSTVYNWGEVKVKMWALNLGKPANVPQLNETMAIELGANLLGEFVIYSIGAGLLIFEYVRWAFGIFAWALAGIFNGISFRYQASE